MKEIFKDIKGYENLYQISNFGNVKSLIGINRSSIWRCCVGKYKKSHNYIWRYTE